MITLFTDFGWQGPYVGQMKLALQHYAPGRAVVDLMHDAPALNINASAYLLAAVTAALPRGSVCCAVIDPGVGHHARPPVILRARDCWFVGPGNGLFVPLALDDPDSRWYQIHWRPAEGLSNSFHGRDLFAPVAALLALGEPIESLATPMTVETEGWGRDLAEVIYIDHYGNCMTGLGAAGFMSEQVFTFGQLPIRYAPTFAYALAGQPFWYENSQGLIEIAGNQFNVAQRLGISIGDKISF
ncbi:MAG: SAM-dependent chlorinase/fluorinase [Gammaproteobacteria bacterium]|nr:SAM-dependent chlorinase/fluorinase [Gammaproteobacteria bacterium]